MNPGNIIILPTYLEKLEDPSAVCTICIFVIKNIRMSSSVDDVWYECLVTSASGSVSKEPRSLKWYDAIKNSSDTLVFSEDMHEALA